MASLKPLLDTNVSSTPPSIFGSICRASFNVRLGLFVTFLIKFSQSIWTGIPMLGYLYTITGNSNTQVGIFATVQGMTCLICAPLAGLAADRFDRASIMRALGVLGVVNIFVNFALFLSDELWIAYPSYVLWGLFSAFSETTMSSLIADGMPTGNRAPLESFRWMLTWVAMAAGPVLNAVVLSLTGNSWELSCLRKVLLFGSFCSIFGMIGAMFFKHSTSEEGKGGASDSAAVCEESPLSLVAVTVPLTGQRMFITSYTNSMMILCCILGQDVVTALGSGMSVQYFQLWFKNDYEVVPTTLAMLNVVTQLTVVCLTYVVANQLASSFGVVKVVVSIRLSAILVLWAMVFCEPIQMLLPLYVIRMAFMNCARPLFRAILMDHTPRKHRGKVNAVDMVRMFSWSGSAALGGWLVDQYGYRANFVVTGFVHCLGLCCIASLGYLDHKYHGALSGKTEKRVESISTQDIESQMLTTTPRGMDKSHAFGDKRQ